MYKRQTSKSVTQEQQARATGQPYKPLAVAVDLPESSIPFSKSFQRPAEAPRMACRALPHRKCDQRGPVDEIILKIAAGNPKGRLSAKETFDYFSSFEK